MERDKACLVLNHAEDVESMALFDLGVTVVRCISHESFAIWINKCTGPHFNIKIIF